MGQMINSTKVGGTSYTQYGISPGQGASGHMASTQKN